MSSLSVDTALSVLSIACIMMCAQLIILTVEIVRMRRDLNALLTVVASLNHAINPWATEDEPTEPRLSPRLPPRGLGWEWLPLGRGKEKRRRPS